MSRQVENDRSKGANPASRLPRCLGAAVILGLVVVGVLAAIGGAAVFLDWWICLPDDTQATYVGRQACVECHPRQTKAWTGSDHDRAMDPATPETVLGDFDGARLEKFGVTSRMFRDGSKYMVHTEGPDGKMHDYRVKYVFGVRPLQQYLVEFDRPGDMPRRQIARLQVLPLCWDTVRGEWFHLTPPDVHEKLAPDDRLHWTRLGQNWNRMCADCHSTNVKKGYDAATTSYHTTFSEIDVSCEACHGPGSIHVRLARARSLFWDRRLGDGLPNLKSDDPKVEIHTCAPCHVRRRRVVAPNFRPGENFYDYFANALITPGAYYADGQILDEVYVYGSFIQSKMYRKGIRCTDCHDPHTTRIRRPGNKLCTSCHAGAHPAGKYDRLGHHHHAKRGSKGAQCVECHMPTSVYMAVDWRRDHSLRIPRPDLSVKLGTPNACTRCHIDPKLDPKPAPGAIDAATLGRLGTDYQKWLLAAREGDEQVKAELGRVDRWCRDWCRRWYGAKQEDAPHYATALAAAWQRTPGAEEKLIALAGNRRMPAIARASALSALRQFPDEASRAAAISALKDADPQVRYAALGNLEEVLRSAGGGPSAGRAEAIEAAAPLLDDPIRLVRSEAGRVLEGVHGAALTGPERRARDKAVAEYERGLRVDSDWALAHVSLGLSAEARGDVAAAIRAYRDAIRVEPDVTGPRANLAGLLESAAESADKRGRTDEAARLRTEVAKLRRQECKLLGHEAELLPNEAVVQYRWGLALYLVGREDEAERALATAHRLEPESADILLRLALLYKKRGKWSEAIDAVRKLLELEPDNALFQHILRETIQQSQQRPPTPSSGSQERR